MAVSIISARTNWASLGFTSEQPAWTNRYAERWAQLYEPKAPPRPVPVAARRVPYPPAQFLQIFRMPGLVELPDNPPPPEIFQRIVLKFDAVPAREIKSELWTLDQWRSAAAQVSAASLRLAERYFLLFLVGLEMVRASRHTTRRSSSRKPPISLPSRAD